MRIDPIYDYVNAQILNVADTDRRHYFYAHVHGVANYSTLLAMRRGLDPQIAVAAALLHDISAIQLGNYDDHANLSADRARDFLRGAGGFTAEEIALVETAIRKHTDDPRAFTGYDALLTEADFLQPYLRNFAKPDLHHGSEKLAELLRELGIESTPFA